MIPSNPIPQVCNYGSSASYCTCPSDEQIANGVVPLDSLPASWWNWLWSKTNTAVNCARYAAGVLIDEVNTVLTQAGVCVNPACVDQLYRAINNIRQTIGTADTAGAVKSSSTASEVAIDPTTGKMSVNCLGNAASLTTTATTVVGAINELKSTYDTCWSNNTTALSGKAPNSHASIYTTYGVGNATAYGHLKISDQYTSVLSDCSGVAASQKAVACVYTYATGKAAVGSTNGCALGTAAAGTATTAARSDHVHPLPSVFGGIAINPGACASYNEGIRINVANNNFATLNIGGAANSVCGAGGFWIGTNCSTAAGKLYINYGASNKASYFQCNADGTVYWCGTAAYATSAGSASSATSACKSYCVMDYCSNTTPLYIGYASAGLTCAQITHLAAFSTNYINGKIIIKDASQANVKSWLGLGTAAACAATAFRPSDWWPNSKFCGAVCQAYMADFAGSAATTVEAECACWACCACRGVVPAANKWDGRSNKSGACWCATAAPAYGGTLFFCNCGLGILLYSVKNGCCCYGGIVPGYGRGTTVCCMCNGTSCAVAWYIYP